MYNFILFLFFLHVMLFYKMEMSLVIDGDTFSYEELISLLSLYSFFVSTVI